MATKKRYVVSYTDDKTHAMARHLARADSRSVSKWMEHLIRAEYEKALLLGKVPENPQEKAA